MRASPRTLSTRVRAKLPPSQLLLRTDRLHLWFITTAALLGAPQPGGGDGGGGGQDLPPDIRGMNILG